MCAPQPAESPNGFDMNVATYPSRCASSLTPFLNVNAWSGPARPAAGAVVDLPLRAGVLAVGGDDVDPERAHLVDDPLDERHPRVPHGVEDVVAGEERLAGLAVEEVELGLDADQRLVAELVAAVEDAAEDLTWCGAERRPSSQKVSQIMRPVASAHGTSAAVAGSGRSRWSAYAISSL